MCSKDDSIDYKTGWKTFQESVSTLQGANNSDEYINNILSEIDNLQQNLDSLKGFCTPKEQLKGDVAEFWHNGTFNINAALNRSEFRTKVVRSQEFASVDISSNWKQNYGLKYYKNAAMTAKAQSIDYWEYFHKYGYDKKMDFFTFLEQRGVSPEEGVKHLSIYFGQQRIVPSDQYKKIINLLHRWQQNATNNLDNPDRAALAAKFEETLKNCVIRIEAPDGTVSYELSKENAEVIAQLAKDGKYDLSKNGFTIEDLMTFEYAMKETTHAGLNAALISLVIKVGPEIFTCIFQLIKNGQIDEEQLKNTGLAAIEGAANGFLTGFTSSAIMTACKSGLLGEAMKQVTPGIVSSLTVIVINTIKDGVLVNMGKMEKSQMANNLTQTLFVTGCSIGFGVLLQATGIPFAYLLGSFVGSMIGSFVYGQIDSFVMALCIDNGYTCFGLVDQDYTLPDHVLKEIGVDVFEYEQYTIDIFEIEEFKIDEFTFNEFEYDKIDITFLRKGVIGVHKIGYITD